MYGGEVVSKTLRRGIDNGSGMQPGGRSSGWFAPKQGREKGAADRRRLRCRVVRLLRLSRSSHHFKTLDADGMVAQQEEIDEAARRLLLSLKNKRVKAWGAPAKTAADYQRSLVPRSGRRVCQKGQPSRRKVSPRGPTTMR